MSHLHEVVAVEGDLRGTKEKILKETVDTFTKRTEHFTGYVKTLQMFSDNRSSENSIDRKELTTTVMDKLDYMKKAFIKFYDAKLQKECANQNAKATVKVDNVEIMKDVPVAFLLAMEEELKRLREVYSNIPTLKPGVSWVPDEIQKEGVYKSEHPVTALKTEKVINSKIVYEATEKHPAQIRDWTEDKAIGKYSTQEWSGMLSPAEKSVILGRLDKLLREFKKARQRANVTEVPKVNIGDQIFNYIHGK